MSSPLAVTTAQLPYGNYGASKNLTGRSQKGEEAGMEMKRANLHWPLVIVIFGIGLVVCFWHLLFGLTIIVVGFALGERFFYYYVRMLECMGIIEAEPADSSNIRTSNKPTEFSTREAGTGKQQDTDIS